MDVPLWIWIVTIAAVIGFFVFDFLSHVRQAHEPSLRESAFWSIFYIVLSLAAGVAIGLVWDWSHAGQFIAGYTTEKALSVDNLFVFLLVMTSFKVPRIAQQKALLIGIAIALAMRTVFIVAGAAILERWSFVFYLFGAWLLWIAIRQAVVSLRRRETGMPGWVGLVRRIVPASEHYDGDRWTVVEGGRRVATPLVLVILALGLTDLLFALDSIPAIFGITQEAYLVFLANALALMGLRQLYFLVGGLLERLVFLDLGLAVVLGFISVKLVFHALHVNEVPFVNGGQPVEWIPEIPTWLSLAFIFGALAVAAIASLVHTRRRKRRGATTNDADAATGSAKQSEHPRARPGR